jgi:N-acetylmuramic acid 6-phosphate etherase
MSASLVKYGTLPTEKASPVLSGLDTKSELELVRLIQKQDRQAIGAVARESRAIAAAASAIAEALSSGGRLIYVGAGTSGRLATLDAAECPPTFGVSEGDVLALMAGGERALSRSIEGAEDSRGEALRAIRKLAVGSLDIVCGVSASGVTPFVRAALSEAIRRGARTVMVTCAPKAVAHSMADHPICLDVGPETIAGSTRMKAGLATKAVLHTLSTVAMIRLGKVYDNLMVDVRPQSKKLQDRARRIVERLTNLPSAEANRLLRRAGGNPKLAVVMGHRGVSKKEAERLLARHKGHLRGVIGDINEAP